MAKQKLIHKMHNIEFLWFQKNGGKFLILKKKMLQPLMRLLNGDLKDQTGGQVEEVVGEEDIQELGVNPPLAIVDTNYFKVKNIYI